MKEEECEKIKMSRFLYFALLKRNIERKTRLNKYKFTFLSLIYNKK